LSIQEKPLDFDVDREPWNKYEVSDHTTIKTKYVITKVTKVSSGGQTNYRIDGQTLTTVLNMSGEKGPADNKIYNPEELKSEIKFPNMRYTTIAEEWNEYRVDDGAVIRLKATVSAVAKTNRFDLNGDPIYLIDNNVMLQVRPPQSPS
jgi:hypothetical protein